MDAPEHCFCGCGRQVGVSTENWGGHATAASLAAWLTYVSLMDEAAAQSGAVGASERENVRQFLDDGRTCYLGLLEAVHGGFEQDRGPRKLTDRWLKFSMKSQKKIARNARKSGMPFDPFEATPDFNLGLTDVREWVFSGTIPSITAEG